MAAVSETCGVCGGEVTISVRRWRLLDRYATEWRRDHVCTPAVSSDSGARVVGFSQLERVER